MHYWLSKQESVCLPYQKETHFFSHDEKFALGVDWYSRQFGVCSKHKTIGEVDPDYLFIAKAPERIRKYINTPKFIVIFRRPIERAYSQYLMSLLRGHEKLPFGEALLKEETRSNVKKDFNWRHYSYMSRSLYSIQVKRYFQFFPHSEFMFLKFEELFDEKNSLSIFNDILSFIEISGKLTIEDAMIKMNVASEPRWQLVNDLLIGNFFWKKVFRILVHEKCRRWLRKAIRNLNRISIKRAVTESEIKKEVPRKAIEIINVDIQELEKLTGLDLSDWIDSEYYKVGPDKEGIIPV